MDLKLTPALRDGNVNAGVSRPPSGGKTIQPNRFLGTKPMRKWGHSRVVSLSRDVRVALGIKDGDIIAFRRVGRYVLMAVQYAHQVIPLSETEKQSAREILGL